ncbi:MAG TPA: hypothetical protein VGZ47_09840 [Gemmataceae bacterium]|jgi:tetratricopeptide (TPR) repeat protein|nr:hypothetical protein [Gemmataceae bacterium]
MGLFDWFKPKKPQRSLPSNSSSSGTFASAEAEDAQLVNKAVDRIGKKDFQGAQALLLEVVSRTPSNYVNQFETDGKVYIKFWDMPEFLGYIAIMQEKGPVKDVIWLPNAYPRAFFYLAYLQIELGNLKQALDYLDHGLILHPDHPKLMNEKAQALTGLRRFREALTIDERAFVDNTYTNLHDKALSLRGRGFVLIELGDLEAAEESFRRSLEYEPESPVVPQELAYIQQLRHKH